MKFENIGILQRRKIEAEIIKPIYEALKEELGTEKAQSIIGKAISQSAIEAGKEMAKEVNGQTTLQSFVDIQVHWTKDDALQTEILEQTDDIFNFNTTRCRYAECYKALGLAEIGFLLSCNRDEKFIEGYAPHIELTRTQTIMEGADFCDFRYRLNKAP